jgi:hypothetical protein
MATTPTLVSFARLVVSISALLAATAWAQTGPRDDYRRGGYPQAQSPTELPIMMRTDATSYPVGTPMTVRLTNRTGRRVGYNLCNSRVERLNNEGDWRETQASLAEACTSELRGLAPEQSATYSFKPGSMQRGQYRLRTGLDDPQRGSRIDVVSNPFMVTHDTD